MVLFWVTRLHMDYCNATSLTSRWYDWAKWFIAKPLTIENNILNNIKITILSRCLLILSLPRFLMILKQKW